MKMIWAVVWGLLVMANHAAGKTALDWFVEGDASQSPAGKIQCYTNALDMGGLSAGSQIQAYHNRGRAHLEQGNFPRAIQDLNKAIEMNPKFAEAYRNRGSAYFHQNNLYQAILDYNVAIQLDPVCAAAYNSRGSAYQKQSNFSSAIADFSKAIKLDPQFIDAYENRGSAYKASGQAEKADADFAMCEKLKNNGEPAPPANP